LERTLRAVCPRCPGSSTRPQESPRRDSACAVEYGLARTVVRTVFIWDETRQLPATRAWGIHLDFFKGLDAIIAAGARCVASRVHEPHKPPEYHPRASVRALRKPARVLSCSGTLQKRIDRYRRARRALGRLVGRRGVTPELRRGTMHVVHQALRTLDRHTPRLSNMREWRQRICASHARVFGDRSSRFSRIHQSHRGCEVLVDAR
jgi:hypothetical protein